MNKIPNPVLVLGEKNLVDTLGGLPLDAYEVTVTKEASFIKLKNQLELLV